MLPLDPLPFAGDRLLMLGMGTSEQILAPPLGLGMLRERTRVGGLRLCRSRRMCPLAAWCQRAQARWRRGKKVTLPWRGRRCNQFWRRPEIREQQRFFELLERNVRIFSQRARQQRVKLCQPRLEGPGNRFRLGVSCGNLMLTLGLPVLSELLTRASGGILGILLRPRFRGVHLQSRINYGGGCGESAAQEAIQPPGTPADP